MTPQQAATLQQREPLYNSRGQIIGYKGIMWSHLDPSEQDGRAAL